MTEAYVTARLARIEAMVRRIAGGAVPSGAAGGVLSGTYPNPAFAADMATQAELDAEASARTTHAALTTTAHGGIVSSADARLTDSRTPTVHGDALHDATVASLSGGLVPTAELGSGTANSTKFLRGDQTWQVPAGGGATLDYAGICKLGVD